MDIVLVGGDFDNETCRPSKIIQMIGKELRANNYVEKLEVYNGGSYDTLEDILDVCEDTDVIMWFPNVSNEMDKVRDIKARYPKKMLVSSKNNLDGKYTVSDLVAHGLMMKSNLMVEFAWGVNCLIFMRLLDPLGNVWQEHTPNVHSLANNMVYRLRDLMSFTRAKSVWAGEAIEPINLHAWFQRVEDVAEDFHGLIKPSGVNKRFLGNTSFRCTRGFPSYRGNRDDDIFVSRRNVDKRAIGPKEFVKVSLATNGDIQYWGPHKPSVDTPIQLRLYKYLPEINFMLHGHVYVEGAPFTEHAIPCGAVEEVTEIMKVIRRDHKDPTKFREGVINLKGHGCILMSYRATYVDNIKYYARPVPERMR
jgi:hypothetical protein